MSFNVLFLALFFIYSIFEISRNLFKKQVFALPIKVIQLFLVISAVVYLILQQVLPRNLFSFQ